MKHLAIQKTVIPKNRCNNFWIWVAKMKKHHKILISSKASNEDKRIQQEEY